MNEELQHIKLGRIDESFHQVAAAVVEEVLIQLGHTVEMSEDSHPVMYPLLRDGAIDLFADAWLPHGHEVYWADVKDSVVEVSALYDEALFFWAIPNYVPEDLVATLHDLAKPEVIEKMTTLAVQGTKPSAGLSMRSDRLLVEYGLDKLGWSHPPGDIDAVIDNVNSRMAAGDWFVTPLWQPMFLNEVHDLRPIADPLRVFPPPDRASLLAHCKAYVRLPERTRDVLARIAYTVADVNTMDLYCAIDGLDPLDAARKWMAERDDLVQGWLA